MSPSPLNLPDDDLVENHSSASTDSRWLIGVMLIICAVSLSAMWYVSRTPIRVSRPTVRVENSRAIVTSIASNRTNKAVRLSLRLLVGHLANGTEAALQAIAYEDLEVHVEPHSTKTVRCEFPLSSSGESLGAVVHVLSRH